MKKLSEIEKHVIFWVDKGSCRAVLLRNRESYTEDELNVAIDGLIADGTLTSSSKSDWVIVTEFMPNTAEKLRAEARPKEVEWIVDVLPAGAILRVDADESAEVSYIGIDHQIRSHHMGKIGQRGTRYFPGFMVPAVEGDLLVLLKRALVEDKPQAQEHLHFIQYGGAVDHFYLCTIWTRYSCSARSLCSRPRRPPQ
jgi:hypothetical protein